MAVVRDRWLSKRAVSLHVAVLVVVPGCAVAAWWQVHRAQDGNTLSYFYSIMWPAFALLGLYFWWLLIHTDYEAVGLKGMRRTQARADTTATDAVPASPAPPPVVPEAPTLAADDDDPELAAYNARLAELSAKGAKTWRNRETVVVRRAQ
jgi:DNA-binding transcriptional regulator of glucitol operon